jgi:5-methylcytosine-specific restriction endonuclease McrA
VDLATYSGEQLLDFVTWKMTMSSYYQPLVIRELIEAGGRRSADDLARRLLAEDAFAVSRARRTLMRWPKIALASRGIVGYDKVRCEFVLPVAFDSDEQREAIVAICTTAIQGWQQKGAPKAASRFFSVIEAAGGRCQACGTPGSIRLIDVDHVIPRARARQGAVTLPDGSRVPVDDIRNLQALCTQCNRGKRDTSTTDFRPSPGRLSETITLVLQAARSAGYDPADVLAHGIAGFMSADTGP